MILVENPKPENWLNLIERPSQTLERIEDTVVQIFEDVKRNGDSAVQKYSALFDGFEGSTLQVDGQAIEEASQSIPQHLKDAIAVAKSNITTFHKAQKTATVRVETMVGVECWQEKRAIERVGLYIPGGTAPLFSTVLMLAIPAQLAGCKEITLCSPPNKNGEIAPEILYAAQLCGVNRIYRVGGIQAIAALTFGTSSIDAVYKIFGPGNQFVTVAKQLATKFGVAIDMPAGPSELLVYADATANASYVASDLLSQAEHGIDSQVVLVSDSRSLLGQVKEQVEEQLQSLPRNAIAQRAIENSRLVLLEDKNQALAFINAYAPEHFILCAEEEAFFLQGIRNAGSVFIGNFTPESAGDYASGTNHTLPTNAFSKAYSGVNLDSFLKSITFQKITAQGLKSIGPSIECMAAAEGLEAHKNAVAIRLKDLNNL